MAGKPKDTGIQVTAVDLAISDILRFGLAASSLLLTAGGIIMFIQEGNAVPHLKSFHAEPPTLTTVTGILESALRGSGEGIIQLGILVLLATPFLRVAFAGYAFLEEHDYVYVTIAAIVLAGLLWGLFA